MSQKEYEAKQEARRQKLLRIAAQYKRAGNPRYHQARELANLIPTLTSFPWGVAR